MVIFPEPIANLPRADIPLRGVEAFLSQGRDHQVIFMEFAKDVDLPEHSHASQWGVVLEGRIELLIGGKRLDCVKGDRYFIPAGIRHSARIHAGYADITFFDEGGRYRPKQGGGREPEPEPPGECRRS